jgi:hypothetical protein
MALTAVLTLFSDPVISEATSPATGAQTRFVWSPNPAELRAFCEAIVDRQRHLAHQDLPPGFQPPPYSRYCRHPDQYAPSVEDQARVGAALARYKAACKPMEAPKAPPWRSPTNEDLYARYGRREADPATPIPFD